MIRLLRLTISFLLIVFTSGVSASHLVGGNLGYEYLGDQGGGMYRYRISLTTYNNCDQNSAIPLPVATQDIWIYEHDVNGNPMGGGDKTYWGTVTLALIDSNKIEPSNPSGCAIGAGTCFYKGEYEATVDLPLNFNGYHLVFDDFARNAAIDNLQNPGGTGMSFHAYIPPNLVDNSSPQFSDDPIPFICVNDTTTLLNTAIDPDGDLLTFTFVTPFAGQNGGGAPNPLPWTINPCQYNIGYSVGQPFGATGYSFINGSTGLTEYMSTQTGNFVVAVEIREFRNGNLIGVTRRDLQLLFINCPNNPSPNLDPTTQQINYTIQEGDSLCFDVIFNDPNGDSLNLEATGQLFDPTFTSPPATITTPVVGDSTVFTEFCWATDCGQASPVPYLFTVSTTDNGCPPKTTNVVYSIQVDPYPPPTAINGPVLICENDTALYSTDDLSGATYDWTVTNGTIISGQGNDTVSVVWNGPGAGNISVFATGPLGCPSTAIDLDVTILAEPVADAGLDTTICQGDTVQIGGSPTGIAGSSFLWSPGGSLDDPSLANPMASPTSTTVYVVEVDNGSCSATDTMTVNVGSTSLFAGSDTSICLGDTAQLLATGGTTYSWTPTDSISDPNIADPMVWPTTTTDYVVSSSDASGCSATDTVTVNVFNLPPADAGPDTSVCQGSGVIIGGSPTGPVGSSFTWTPSASLDDPTIANPTATPTASPTTYIVEVSLGSCQNSDTVVVSINALPTADAGTDQSICDGDCAALTGTGGGDYSWSPTSGLSDPTISNPDACPGTTTTYTLTVTDGNGCQDTDDITITVNPNPVADAGLDQTICEGGSIQIGGSPTGPVGSTYSWTPTADLDDPTLANPTAAPSSTTVYTVNVTDGNGCQSTDDIVITVNPLPFADAGPDTTICASDSVMIGGSPTGPAGSTFSWSPVTGLDDPSLANPTTGAVGSTTYIVTVTDPAGCSQTDTTTINVSSAPSVDAGNDTTICQGDTVILGGSPTSSGAATYAWTPSSALDDSTLANPQGFPDTATSYVVIVTDGLGCSASDTINVSIDSLPSIDAGPDEWLCPGNVVGLNATGSGTFTWTPSTGLSNPNISNPDASPADTTTYIVTLVDVNNCSNTDTMTVFVNDDVPVDAGNDTTICEGDTVMLGGNPTSGAVGTTYSWTPVASLDDPSLANPMATPTTTTTYYVMVSNDTCTNIDSITITVNSSPSVNAGNDVQFCLGDSVQLNASGALSYAWSPSTDLSNDTIADPFASPTDTTEYIVTGLDMNGCSGTDTVNVIVNPIPQITAEPDTAICSGDTIQVNAFGGDTYAWTPSQIVDDSTLQSPLAFPATSTDLMVFVTDTNSCVSSDTITITVNSSPQVNAGPDEIICQGDTAQLSASGAVNYTWQPTDSLSNPNIGNPQAWPSDTTTYIVTGTDGAGCTGTDTVIIIVAPLPNINAGADTSICLGDTAQLSGSGGVGYFWTPSASLSDPGIANPLAFPDATTDYILTASDSNDCANSDTVTVTVLSLPAVDAGMDQDICMGDTTQLDATGSGSFNWTPSMDMDDNTLEDPFVWPDTTTTFVVTITDANGCVNSDSTIVNVFRIETIPDTSICIGDSVQLGVVGNAGQNYTWTPSTGLSDPNIANPWASPSVATTYTVSVTGSSGCVDVDSVTVTVNGLPTADITVDWEPGCLGVTGIFENNSSGAQSYLWNFGDGNTSTSFEAEYTFDYNSVGNGYVVAINNFGCTDTVYFTETFTSFEDYFDIDIPNVFTPNGDGLNDEWKVNVDADLKECTHIEIRNRWGQLMFVGHSIPMSWDGRTQAGLAVPDGTYFYTIVINGLEFNGFVNVFR